MGILTAILAVFTSVGEWIVTTIPKMLALFWTPGEGAGAGSLTLLGVLAVAGLSISVVFLLIGFIQKFLHFRG